MALLAAYIIFLFVSVIGSIGFSVGAVCELVYLYRVQTPERKVIVQRVLFLLATVAALICITVHSGKESNKTESGTLTFQAGAPIIISSEGAYSIIECSDGEIVISKVAD